MRVLASITAILALSLSCSSHREPADGDTYNDVVATHAFDAVLARATPFSPVGRTFRGALGDLRVELPSRATGAVHVARNDEQWIELNARDVRDCAAEIRGAAVVFPAADIMYVASGGALEELRVVRGGASYLARYDVRTGPGIASLRARDGRIEAVDERGVVRIGSAPAFLVDRAGQRRELAARVERDGPHTFQVSLETSLAGLTFPVVVDPVWSTVASMKVPRIYHGSITLGDGKVLAFGGQTSASALTATSERYDPATNVWTDVGNLPSTAFELASALLLKSGKVFASADANVALYDPTSATWTSTAGPMFGYADAPVVLDDGRVLGFQRGGENLPMSWSESTRLWTTHAAPPTSGLVHFATVKLADGRVLVAGGVDQYSRVHTTSQIYAPSTDAWTVTGSLLSRRERGVMLRLASGKILLASGSGPSGDLSTTEIFDPSRLTWTAGPTLPSVNGPTSLTPLPGGSVLVFNDRVARMWREGLTLLEDMSNQPSGGPFQPTAVPLSDGALVMGGATPTIVSTVSRLVPLSLGAACSALAPGDCASGYCTDGVCCASSCEGPCQQCGGSGACMSLTGAPRLGRTCAPYAVCVAGACASSCTSNADCDSASYCVGSACVAKKANGSTCGAASECTSGRCVDSVCCNSPCTGQCEACDLPTSPGTCAATVGLPRGGRTACSPSGECGKVCDGVTRSTCVYLPAGSSPCGANGCSGGIETHASTCNGAGACSDVPKSCGSYVCGPVSCKAACGGKADCAAGFLCALGACVPAPGLGDACTSGAECSTGFCVDGVCCGVPSCGAGSTCAATGAAGQCRKTLGIACATGAECESAICVDGVCCESACTGQCEACAIPGSVGKCVAAKGAPRGARTACASDSSSPCASRACDGVERNSCVGFAPGETACRAAACVDGVATTAATCDGAGSCPAATTIACGAYACDADGIACRTRCDDAAHCAMGNACIDGACVPATATCSPDGLARFDADGTVTSCAPFKCKGGACATSCGTSTDCAPGLVCADAQCVAAPSSEDSGGCAVTRAPSRMSAWWIGGVAILFFTRRRRSALSAALVAAASCSPSRIDPTPTQTTAQPIAISSAPETLYPHARAWALTLSGGDVLVGGGEVIGKPERRSASTGKWSEAAWSYVAYDSVAIPISGGKVLVAGMRDFATPRPAEVFDPSTNTSAPTGTMIGEHTYALGAWLPSVGKALVAGGQASSTSAVLSTAELWNPSTGTWAATGAMSVPRVLAASVTLSTGRVLAIGGSGIGGSVSALSSVESYDPATGSWSLLSPMTRPRSGPAVVLLTDGRVLVAGGVDATFGSTSTAEIYTPSTNAWTALPNMASARSGAMGARLPSGRAFVGGGATDASIEVYDPVRNAWLSGGAMTTRRGSGAIATLADGRLLLVGGYGASLTATWDVDVFSEQPNGATCTGGGECTSGFCVDGRCCNTACSGACQACDVTGSLGTCSGISGLPRTGHPSCAPYVSCIAGSCATTCASDGDCASTAWCSAGSCVAKKANGSSCTAPGQCTSGSCADGVCCNTACAGQCEACAETGRVGTCTTIAGSPRGARPACVGIAVGGQCGIQCNGVEPKGCVYPPATRSCSAPACSAGIETHASTCNGVGLCNDVPKTCGAFACGTVACKTTCSVTTDCAAGFVCKSSTCVPAPGLGMACSTSAPCEGGLFCVDGVCCGESTCAAGRSCGLPATAGRCAKIDGQTCASDGECGSGVCVDGVCCESRCGGQCQACDVPGSLGKCVAVSGTPHGARPACATGTTSCEATSCDGSDGSRCAALADTSVTCRDASCTDDIATLASSCDGKGSCAGPVTVACAPYKCAGAKCANSCATSDDCAKGHECTTGACTKAVTHCSSDGVAVVDPEGSRASCLPFRCRDAACLAKCATSDDCAPGTLCDGNGACTTAPAAAPTEEGDGGCTSAGGRPTRPASGVSLLILALVAAAKARRRARDRARTSFRPL